MFGTRFNDSQKRAKWHQVGARRRWHSDQDPGTTTCSQPRVTPAYIPAQRTYPPLPAARAPAPYLDRSYCFDKQPIPHTSCPTVFGTRSNDGQEHTACHQVGARGQWHSAPRPSHNHMQRPRAPRPTPQHNARAPPPNQPQGPQHRTSDKSYCLDQREPQLP